jgi:hypothetical protein
MIKSFVEWLHRGGSAAMAFWAIVCGALLAWIVNVAFVVILKLTIGYNVSFADLFGELMPHVHQFVLGMVIVAAGIYRAAACHPLANRKYGIWLAQTPWQYSQPLPLGPIHLAWQDAAVMACAAAMACLPPTQFSLVFGLPWLYPLAYAVTLCVVHWFAGTRWPVVLAVALLGAVILTRSGIAIAFSLAIFVPVVWWTIGAVLRDFPYSEAKRRELGLLPYTPRAVMSVHWPVVPEPKRRWYERIDGLEAFIGAAIIGWMMFAIAVANRHEPDIDQGLRAWHLVFAMAAITCRLGFYVVEHLPPISLLGRWKWRQFVVPGYDVVFVAPIAAALAAFLLPGLLIRSGISPLAAVPIATTVTIWLAAALPPKWEDWHYTGHHRCSVTGLANTKLEVQS